MIQSRAEEIAIAALGFIAEDPESIADFLAASGASPADLRLRAADPAWLGFVLDFVLSDESLARPFCEMNNLPAEQLHHARAALPGGQVPDWT